MLFHFTGTKLLLLKITTKRLPAKSSTKNAFLNRAVLLKLIEKKAMKIIFWVPGKMLHFGPWGKGGKA